MKKILCAAVLGATILAGGSAFAQDSKALDKQANTPETYVAPMGTQFVRGIVNMGTGWGEIPRQIVLSAECDGAALCAPYGLARGTYMTVARTFYGAMETVFFFIPFGDNYDSAMNPAYVWQEAKAEKKVSK